MSLTWVLLNVAYLVYAVSGMFKEILKLRAVLLIATGFFMAYGATAGIWSVFWWNVPVGAVHVYQIWALLKERRGIDLDDEADAIHTLQFPDLDRLSFNTLWHLGVERNLDDKEVLIVRDEPVDDLMLILGGEVDVLVDEHTTVRLSALRMLGEMSHVSGDNASADVVVVGDVRLRCWNKRALAELGEKQPEIERAVLRAIGHELARKLT